MLPKDNLAKQISQKFSPFLPVFQDYFDEESFYIFAFILVIIAFIGAFFASRHIKIKDAGHLD